MCMYVEVNLDEHLGEHMDFLSLFIVVDNQMFLQDVLYPSLQIL